MINMDYSNMYGQYLNDAKSGKAKSKILDKSKLSKNMEYLEAAKSKVEKTKESSKKKETNGADKSAQSKEFTQEDIQKLYAEINGINYGSYDGKDSYRQMANSFLNQMVFSHMGSSKELFVPQMSHNVLSAAFNAAYDFSDVEEKIRQSGDEDAAEDTDAAESVETE